LTGATGNASGPHLHYEVLVRGRPINPGGQASGSHSPGVHSSGRLRRS
jgi:murein DD-endopeptidase MepM/ murein hydrolase activator NlpD